MVKSKKITEYHCGHCGTSYMDEWDADDCCKDPTVEEIKWECSECDKEFKTEHEANECCANKSLTQFKGEKKQ